MPYHTASTSGLATVALLLVGSTATAQILGCDAVGCPVDEYRNAQCEIGNATLKAIGIANVTTSLDPQPLTWTLGLQENKRNGTEQSFDQNFYLGTPPSLRLDDTVGCALFFEGISANLTASNGDQLDNFTCSDALAESCVTDLIAKAQSSYKAIGNVTNAGPELCNRLRESLVDEPPSTCNGVKESWGTILAQPLTGDSAPAHVDQTQCHPTTGQDYDVYLVASNRKTSSSREWSQLAPIFNAITPVMTVFSKGGEADVKLTCLKLVESRANQTHDVPHLQGSASLLSLPSVSSLALIAITYIVLL